MNLQRMLEAIDANKARLDATRPLSPPALASLQQRLRLEWTPDANATEHHARSLREAQVVLDNLKIGDKSLRQHCETMGRPNAMRYIEEIIASNEPISTWQIRNIHNAVLKRRVGEEACRYRHVNVAIADARTTPPDFLDLPAELAALVEWHAGAGHMHPIERAAELHARFVRIHPFVDGNGRTGRLLLNIELMKSSYPPAVIRDEDRAAYCDSLDDACASNNYAGIARLIAESVLRSFDLYFDALGLAVDQGPSWAPR
ncbi:filamentation induced by cAMP protein Fic [Caballeronia cordobensis]|uniref:Filamentation induced by cAMP protein Fic n=1 Tax=Caballeronia cordobensis TaxID=1353886 RepID=A0A158ILH1_CABCO|nr:Fic family protein [Caballeronia cordobensis]SAL57398.1 filamentation induced by cAMP protein Fic [Caballeronia cordobensis]